MSTWGGQVGGEEDGSTSRRRCSCTGSTELAHGRGGDSGFGASACADRGAGAGTGWLEVRAGGGGRCGRASCLRPYWLRRKGGGGLTKQPLPVSQQERKCCAPRARLCLPLASDYLQDNRAMGTYTETTPRHSTSSHGGNMACFARGDCCYHDPCTISEGKNIHREAEQEAGNPAPGIPRCCRHPLRPPYKRPRAVGGWRGGGCESMDIQSQRKG